METLAGFVPDLGPGAIAGTREEAESEVLHVFTMNSGLIAAVDLGDEAGPTAGRLPIRTLTLSGYPPSRVLARSSIGAERAKALIQGF